MRTAQLHLLTGFAHMPMIGRSAEEFRRYATVFTVSRYCIDLLRESGISSVYPHALYGTGILDRVASRDTAIKQKSAYHWDMRKGRDRLLALAERILGSGRSREPFDKRAGLTLGIVSLLSPIKQFPMLFDIIAPHLAQYSQVNLEIFGSGGYAQVRDLKRSLLPMTGRVRLWGYHEDVENIYPQLDYLLTGLPEKEALGLNVLEAQTLGTPALAPAAPPFTETIVHEANGFLYRDPRTDGGVGFNELIASIVGGRPRPDPLRAVEHLAKFSYETMVERAKLVIAHLERSLSSSPHHLG